MLIPPIEPMPTQLNGRERGLCQTCAQYDWESHLVRYLKGNVTRPAFCCEVDGLSSDGQNSVVRKLSAEASHRWLSETRALFQLSSLATMLDSRADCSLCRLIVDAVNVFVAPERLKYFVGHEGPVEVTVVDPGATHLPDYTVLFITIEADEGDENESMDLYFTFEASSSTESSFSRHIISAGQVELDTVKAWWKTCDQDHTACMTELSAENGPDEFVLRVIDVVTDRVIVPPPGSKYVALSYVWGRTNPYHASWADFIDPTLTPPVKKQVSRQAYLPLHRGNLPQTIRDAMVVVGAIGERYLWVDALCIVQDCEEEKIATIAAMDEIYKSASLTIFAAGGIDANSGLGGVRPASRAIKNVTGILEGICLVNAEDPFDLEGTVWSSRGWTFQEEIFSKRCVIFVNDRVYYECPNGCWGEARPTERLPRRMRRAFVKEHGLLPMDDGVSRDFDTYSYRVSQYARRELTYESDILYVFAGIMREYETANHTKSCWGLPLDAFNQALLWRNRSNRHGLSRRVARRIPDAPPFPSWSWAGWVGSVVYGRSTHEGRIIPQVTWPWERAFGVNAFADGILEFLAQSAILDHAVLEQDDAYCKTYEQGRFNEELPESVRRNAYFRFDDGTYWRSGSRECILLSRKVVGIESTMRDEENSFLLMIVTRNRDGMYFREGWLTISKNVWEAAKPIRKQILLG
jgi:hypothetical protein